MILVFLGLLALSAPLVSGTHSIVSSHTALATRDGSARLKSGTESSLKQAPWPLCRIDTKCHSFPLADTAVTLRGGAGMKGSQGEDASLWTLLVRVFLPTYGRKTEVEGRGLDVYGGGVMTRIQRLFSGLLRLIPGISTGKTNKGEADKEKRKETGDTMTSHLETTYRMGNANYRIQKELKAFMNNPPDNCNVSVGKNIRVWIITITGAEGTLYAGEKFRLRVSFPEDYPTKPPGVYFLQNPPPPKHQHIYTNGDICLSLLSTRDWKPNLTVGSLALSILSMLSSAKEKRLPEDNAAHAHARPGQAQEWIYHDDLC
ncbi:unnamed protein product [Discosporangium mesarthrocarpum]